MKTLKKPCLVRILAGSALGLAAVGLFHKPLFWGGFSMPPGCQVLIEALGMAGAMAAAAVLFALLGATTALATLPFASDGRSLVLHSLIHFCITVAEVSLILYLCVGLREGLAFAFWIGILALFYAVIWLGRWIGWYMEVVQLRTLLGLAPGPSPALLGSLLRWISRRKDG